jgi:hypothetical protein
LLIKSGYFVFKKLVKLASISKQYSFSKRLGGVFKKSVIDSESTVRKEKKKAVIIFE